MNSKKITALLTVTALALGIAGCSQTTAPTDEANSSGAEQTEQTEQTEHAKKNGDHSGRQGDHDRPSGKSRSNDSGENKNNGSANKKKPSSGSGQKESSHLTGQVKSISGTSVTLVKGTLKKAASSDSGSSDKVYEFTPDSSSEETTLDLSQIKDLKMEDITVGKVLVITLDKDGKPSNVKVRTPGDKVISAKPDTSST